MLRNIAARKDSTAWEHPKASNGSTETSNATSESAPTIMDDDAFALKAMDSATSQSSHAPLCPGVDRIHQERTSPVS
jgi:hypothetical protein